MNNFKLVGLNFCPFIQPIIITLNEKKIQHEIIYIQPGEKDDWLLKLSPKGITPFLTYNDKVIFESMIINDFVDEVTEGSLYPRDTFLKAQNRILIKRSYDMLELLYDLKTVDSFNSFVITKEKLIDILQSLEKELSDSIYFNSDQFCMIDSAYAPVFRTIAILDKYFATNILPTIPRLNKWSHNVLCRESVEISVVDDFEHIVLNTIALSNTLLSSNLKRTLT